MVGWRTLRCLPHLPRPTSRRLHASLCPCLPPQPRTQYGIVRDVIQNHLLQILALFAMEQPVSEARACEAGGRRAAPTAAAAQSRAPQRRLCIPAPDPPCHALPPPLVQASLDAEDIRNEKVKVLKSMQQVRGRGGQADAGWCGRLGAAARMRRLAGRWGS